MQAHSRRLSTARYRPFVAYLAPGVHAQSPQSLRRLLAPLCLLAETRDLAIVVVRHVAARFVRGKLLYGGGRTTALAAARSGLLIVEDPYDSHGQDRILLNIKPNLGLAPPALSYHLEPTLNGASIVAWDGPCAVPGQVFDSPILPEPGPFDYAVELIYHALAKGACRADDIFKRAGRQGISHATLRRAKSWLGVSSRKFGPKDPRGPGWLWDISDEARAELARIASDAGYPPHDDDHSLPCAP